MTSKRKGLEMELLDYVTETKQRMEVFTGMPVPTTVSDWEEILADAKILIKDMDTDAIEDILNRISAHANDEVIDYEEIFFGKPVENKARVVVNANTLQTVCALLDAVHIDYEYEFV